MTRGLAVAGFLFVVLTWGWYELVQFGTRKRAQLLQEAAADRAATAEARAVKLTALRLGA